MMTIEDQELLREFAKACEEEQAAVALTQTMVAGMQAGAQIEKSLADASRLEKIAAELDEMAAGFRSKACKLKLEAAEYRSAAHGLRVMAKLNLNRGNAPAR